MYNLVVVVLSIALLSLVVAGGISYFPSDIAVRAETADRVSSSHRLILSAVNSYKLANRGASPTAAPIARMDKTVWLSEVAPYLPGEKPYAPEGMSWVYGTNAEGKQILCLVTDDEQQISHGVLDGLASAANRSRGAMKLSTNCESVEEIVNFEGRAALIEQH